MRWGCNPWGKGPVSWGPELAGSLTKKSTASGCCGRMEGARPRATRNEVGEMTWPWRACRLSCCVSWKIVGMLEQSGLRLWRLSLGLQGKTDYWAISKKSRQTSEEAIYCNARTGVMVAKVSLYKLHLRVQKKLYRFVQPLPIFFIFITYRKTRVVSES